VDDDHVWMVQRAGGASFLLETAQPIRIGRKGRRENLDRDVAAEAFVVGPIHFAHAAFPESGQQFVATETSAYREHHRRLRLYSRDYGPNAVLPADTIWRTDGIRSGRRTTSPQDRHPEARWSGRMSLAAVA